MAILIGPKNAKRHERLLNAVYKFRHQFFVDGLGWEDLRKPDGLEKDQFDDLDDVYHVVEEVDGQIMFYCRMMPTSGPTLLADVYPQLMKGAAPPCSPNIWEWTRGAQVTSTSAESKASSLYQRRFYIAALEAFEFLAVRKVSVQLHPLLTTKLIQIGYDVMPLALPSDFDGTQIVPLLLKINDQTLSKARARFEIHDLVLELDEEVRIAQRRNNWRVYG